MKFIFVILLSVGTAFAKCPDLSGTYSQCRKVQGLAGKLVIESWEHPYANQTICE